MAAEPKPAYKLTVKLDGAKPELIAEALRTLRNTASDYDQSGESSAQMIIEAHQESPLTEIMETFENWLFHHAPGLDCEMRLARPGLRPETREMLARAKQQTPMDNAGWDGDEAVSSDVSSGERAVAWLERRERMGRTS